jgi:hypothetical protein
MQAPPPTPKQNSPKEQSLGKKSFKKQLGNQWIFLGGSRKFLGSLYNNVNLSSLQCKSGDVKMVI